MHLELAKAIAFDRCGLQSRTCHTRQAMTIMDIYFHSNSKIKLNVSQHESCPGMVTEYCCYLFCPDFCNSRCFRSNDRWRARLTACDRAGEPTSAAAVVVLSEFVILSHFGYSQVGGASILPREKQALAARSRTPKTDRFQKRKKKKNKTTIKHVKKKSTNLDPICSSQGRSLPSAR